MSVEFDRIWWEQNWTEQEDAMWQAFGPSHPPDSVEGYVISFDFQQVPLPGACAYVFPPNPGGEFTWTERREQWLYATHGLAQFVYKEEWALARDRGASLSGAGYEFAMIVDQPADWIPGLLQWLMAYAHGTKPINRGDRFPFCLISRNPGDVNWIIGGSGEDDDACVDAIRALVFWPYLSRYGTFTASTGCWDMRVATAITAPEWELAKATSSCHLLLLLRWAGIGQRTVPGRASVTERPGWETIWSELETLSFVEAKARLAEVANKMHWSDVKFSNHVTARPAID